jgi:hypothetical protein
MNFSGKRQSCQNYYCHESDVSNEAFARIICLALVIQSGHLISAHISSWSWQKQLYEGKHFIRKVIHI